MKLIDVELAKEICAKHNIVVLNCERFTVGQGNYVYKIDTDKEPLVLRISENSYDDTLYLLKQLDSVGVNVSRPLYRGNVERYRYMICTYIEGNDLGVVYSELNDEDKRNIAKEVIDIQKRVSLIQPNGECDILSWVNCMLDRARSRILRNGYFASEKVDAVEGLIPKVKEYFDSLVPVVYLDDISTKNLLIHNGHVSGVIDVDWLGYGDPLTFIALTNVALLDMEYDTDYVKYLLKEKGIFEIEYRAFIFYSLLYCVDFMGERGTVFNGKTVKVNEQIVTKLNNIYNDLFSSFVDTF